MDEELTGNVLVAQSGGPSAVINASLAGVITEALNHGCVEEIYGSLNGVLGILSENLVDLAEESQQAIRGLRHTPGAALGTCRYKLKTQQDFERLMDVIKAHNIRFFFYIGGNDSQDTTNRIHQMAQEQGYELRAIGIPKTIDNDLPVTDHCPGYGSVIKYVSTAVKEIALDSESIGQHDFVSIVEVMGRNTGWIAAGSSLARQKGDAEDAPHLIYLPEYPLSEEKFLQDVQAVLQKKNFCMVVASEGLVDAEGNYLGASKSTDSFGHANLGGVGEYLKGLVEEHLGIKARSCKLGIAQRAAAHCSSKRDNDEAFQCGIEAVKAAVTGESGKMVTLYRNTTDQAEIETSLVDLGAVANEVKAFPEAWMTEDFAGVTHQFYKYANPLIQGEVEVPYENGLPKYIKLKKSIVAKQLADYAMA